MEVLSVLASQLGEDGLQLQVGVEGKAYATVPYAGGFGFVCRPLDAKDGSHARVCVESGVAYSGMDERGIELAGALRPGEACFYAPGGKSRVVLKLDGTVALVSEDASGNTAMISIGPNGFDVAFDSARLHLDAEKFSVFNNSGMFFLANKAFTVLCKAVSILGKFTEGGPSKQAAIQSIPLATDPITAVTAVNMIITILKGLV